METYSKVSLSLSLLRERADLEGKATFENVECTFPVHRVHPTGECGGPSALAQGGDADIVECGRGLDGVEDGRLHIEIGQGGFHQICSFHVGRQLLDSVSIERKLGADDERIGGRSKKMGFGPQAYKPVVDEYLCQRGAGGYGDPDGDR